MCLRYIVVSREILIWRLSIGIIDESTLIVTVITVENEVGDLS